MALTSTTNAGTPDGDKIKFYGKGNWRLATLTTDTIIYSTDGKQWFQLNSSTSPVVLYSTGLYVNVTDSNGTINQVPDEIIPRYSRTNENKSKDEIKPEVENPILPNYYDGVI